MSHVSVGVLVDDNYSILLGIGDGIVKHAQSPKSNATLNTRAAGVKLVRSLVSFPSTLAAEPVRNAAQLIIVPILTHSKLQMRHLNP